MTANAYILQPTPTGGCMKKYSETPPALTKCSSEHSETSAAPAATTGNSCSPHAEDSLAHANLEEQALSLVLAIRHDNALDMYLCTYVKRKKNMYLCQ